MSAPRRLKFWLQRRRYGQKHPAKTGSNHWATVRLRRRSIEIEKHRADSGLIPAGTIRLVPYAPNCGVFVEFVRTDGSVGWRNVMTYSDFWPSAQRNQEVSAQSRGGGEE